MSPIRFNQAEAEAEESLPGGLIVSGACDGLPSTLGPGESVTFEMDVSTDLNYLTEYAVGVMFLKGNTQQDWNVGSGSVSANGTETISVSVPHSDLVDIFGSGDVSVLIYGNGESTILGEINCGSITLEEGDGTGGFTGEKGVISCDVPAVVNSDHTFRPSATVANEDFNDDIGRVYIGWFFDGNRLSWTPAEVRHGQTTTVSGPEITYSQLVSAAGSGEVSVEVRGVGAYEGVGYLALDCGTMQVEQAEAPDQIVSSCSISQAVGPGGSADLTATVSSDPNTEVFVQWVDADTGTVIEQRSGTTGPNGHVQLTEAASYDELQAILGGNGQMTVGAATNTDTATCGQIQVGSVDDGNGGNGDDGQNGENGDDGQNGGNGGDDGDDGGDDGQNGENGDDQRQTQIRALAGAGAVIGGIGLAGAIKQGLI